jgi:divalent metal cation (Fe/Co/Zn/Cd) transporter
MHAAPAQSQAKLVRQGLLLEYVTCGWNLCGAAILIATALAADSVALAGFGLDSAIEVFASLVVVWQLSGVPRERERRALQLIGLAFVVVALYVLASSLRTLAAGSEPDTSGLGLIWVALTLAAMLTLAFAKRRVGQRLANPVLTTEARVTLIDAYLAAAVLLGLSANAALGWSWADPAAALAIVYYAVREGLRALTAGQAHGLAPPTNREPLSHRDLMSAAYRRARDPRGRHWG